MIDIDLELAWSLVTATVRVSTPLLFAALGGFFSERAGVINISLEGMMLLGAFFGAVVTLSTGSPWVGMMGAAFAGSTLALFYGVFALGLKANQVVAGTALNMFAMGVCPFLGNLLYGSTSSTPSLAREARFTTEPVWLAWGCVAAIWAWARFTRSGLWHSFAGEHPAALRTAGVSVHATRWASLALSGALAGLGGGTLSLCLSSTFSRNMTAGRGFMALAALILGKWKPVPTACACLLFAFSDAVQIRLQGVRGFDGKPLPVQFIQILPYLVTLLILAGFIGRARAPKALGQPFDKD